MGSMESTTKIGKRFYPSEDKSMFAPIYPVTVDGKTTNVSWIHYDGLGKVWYAYEESIVDPIAEKVDFAWSRGEFIETYLEGN